MTEERPTRELCLAEAAAVFAAACDRMDLEAIVAAHLRVPVMGDAEHADDS